MRFSLALLSRPVSWSSTDKGMPVICCVWRWQQPDAAWYYAGVYADVGETSTETGRARELERCLEAPDIILPAWLVAGLLPLRIPEF